MALQKTIVTPTGLTVENAYIRVSFVSITTKTKGVATAAYYTNSSVESAFQAQSFEFEYILEGDNPVAQGYVYLKTLPEFQDAVDC